jgi:2-polyprenyl-6-methoxyphenol hydroxylase-like FAD-dependent oxidoreductase
MATTLVAGAGPVGLTLAIELARYGIEVRIVDVAPARSVTSKALVIWSRTLELIERTGCAPAFLNEGNIVTAASIAAGKKPIGRITFDGVASPYPYALMLPQSDTERLLEAHLNGLGVFVERGVQLTRFTAADEAVTSTLRHADGREEVIETDWLAGCDGAHSAVRHALGMDFAGDTLASDWILADVHLTGISTPRSELQFIWHENGVLALFPITQNRYRVIADVGTSAGAPRRDPTLAEVQAVMDRRGPGNIQVSEPVWLASFGINERKVRDYRVNRVFLAGDAAHIHSPAGGQGMNTGMQDAFNLAWKLALVASGVCAPEPLLSSYSTERSEVGDRIVAATGYATALAVTKNPAVQFVRNRVAHFALGFAAARRTVAETLTEVSIGYPRGPLTHEVSHVHAIPRAGSRAPIRSNEPVVGAGRTPRFALFSAASDAATRLCAQNADLLDQVVREPFEPRSLWLVRPDGYVGLAAPNDALGEVQTYLDELRA